MTADFLAPAQPGEQKRYQGLLCEGVIARPVGGCGMPGHLRVSIGLSLENTRFLEALAKVLARD